MEKQRIGAAEGNILAVAFAVGLAVDAAAAAPLEEMIGDFAKRKPVEFGITLKAVRFVVADEGFVADAAEPVVDSVAFVTGIEDLLLSRCCCCCCYCKPARAVASPPQAQRRTMMFGRLTLSRCSTHYRWCHGTSL